MLLSENEIRALRYYEGDVEGSDPFWGDRKAYLTLNSLLYPGIRNELARAKEGKKLNPSILDYTHYPLLELYGDLFSALCKGSSREERRVYRVERYSDYLAQKEAGKTLSFTSTSTAGFLKAYSDRIGTALLRIVIPTGIPALDYGQALEHYAKAEEHEILLPPFLPLHCEEIPLSEEEKTILDAQGDPPRVSCICYPSLPQISGEAVKKELADPSAGRRVYEALNSGQEPEEEDLRSYLVFKKSLQDHLKALFAEKMQQAKENKHAL